MRTPIQTPILTLRKPRPKNEAEAAHIIIDALIASKEYLWNGKGSYYTPANINKDYYVCYAVMRALRSRKGGLNAWRAHIDYLRKYISRAINNMLTFEDWLESMNGVKYASGLSEYKIQSMRFQWVDKMIADLTKEYL